MTSHQKLAKLNSKPSSAAMAMTEPEAIRNRDCENYDSGMSSHSIDSERRPYSPIPLKPFPPSRQESITQAYYNSSSESDPVPPNLAVPSGSTKQSSHLPKWVWFLASKCLGIPLHAKDRPVLGTFLHVLTFGSALTFFTCIVWYSVYDVLSNRNQVAILRHTVNILLTACWCALGLYAKKLCLQVFQHPQFMRDIRMHTRTFFRINAAVVVFTLGAFFTFVNNADRVGDFQSETCENINLSPIVCKLGYTSRVLYSVFALIWNTLASAVYMSVCRTHTIGIRRFIRELEKDAIIYEMQYAHLFCDRPLTQDDICQETVWLEDEVSQKGSGHFKCAKDARCSLVNPCTTVQRSQTFTYGQRGTNRDNGHQSSLFPTPEHEIGLLKVPIFENLQEDIGSTSGDGDHQDNILEECDEATKTKKPSFTDSEANVADFERSEIMTSPEILHRHWKISCRLRLVSSALQRWLCSFVCMVIIWCAIWLVTWLKTPATLFGILQFALPLLLLPLLCSAMAEVNLEGLRVSKCICPTEGRLQLIQFLSHNPLQMTVYGYNLSYGTILTVVFGILAAFVSRLMFAELGT